MAERNQKDVYDILSFVHEKYGLSEVYMEGITKESEGLVNEYAALIYTDLIDVFYKRGFLDPVNDPKASYMNTPGGDLRMVVEKKLKCVGVESGEFSKMIDGMGEMSKEKADEFRHSPVLFDEREDAFLGLVSKEEKPWAVYPLGGIHAFGGERSCGSGYDVGGRRSHRDNIHEWNRRNPQKFSLVEIVPQNY